MLATETSWASKASSAALLSSMSMMCTSAKAGLVPCQAELALSTTFCLGVQETIVYGPSWPGSWVVNFLSFNFSTATFGRIEPDSDAIPIIQVATNGDFSTMTPLYLSLTSTRSRVGQRALQSDFSMRSKEYLTSSAVSSPGLSLPHLRGVRSKPAV